MDRTLFFIGAHPDDETFGVGGTLAQYAAAGVKVYYLCATRGEVGSADPVLLKNYASIGDLRWAELECAAQILGLAGVIYLGYRDSGMPGSEDNKHPQALVNIPLDEVTQRIVVEIRRLKPQVIVTFDPIGGYRHPDHIAIHKAAEKAFHAAADKALYPEAGPVFHPQKLFYSVFPRSWFKFAIRLLPLFGQDPHHFGRNKDIDLASLVEIEFPIHAVVRLGKDAVRRRQAATACHASQLGGGSPRRSILGFVTRLFGEKDRFMQAYPPPGKKRARDLFEGIR